MIRYMWTLTMVAAVLGMQIAFCAESAQEPSPEKDLTIEESIQIAFRKHGDVLAAQEQLNGAKQRVIISRSSLMPQIAQESTYTSYSQSRREQGGVTVPERGNSSGVSRQYSLALSQKLWDSGQTRSRVHQSEAGVRRVEASVRLARENIAYQVTQAYFEQLKLERLLALARQQVEQAKKHLERVQAQVDAGISARIDLQPVRVELSKAQYALIAAESNDRIAATNLRNALGLERGPRLKLQDVGDAVPAPTGNLNDYVAEAMRFRADLAQVRANVVQSRAVYDLARIEARPLLDVTCSYDLGLFDSPLEKQWTVSGALTIPLFNGGALRAQERDARSSLEADKIQLQQLEKDICAEVQTSYEELVSTVEGLQAARAVVEEARENLAAATRKYTLGMGLVIETVDAQVQLFNAEISAAQALYDCYTAKAALDRAIGRWAREKAG